MPLERYCWEGKGFEYNKKIMIIKFRSCHLILWILEKSIVCESLGKGLVVQEEDASPPMHPT
jgi:hypothetical protein